ncbi:hypothetical protein [Shewanella sp. NIFS-20-20]|uniref:hypothetical protein n=1 Tax=Shewanella sp. NIFS-20-20 TaxID=2853806 RepID=UPI001C450C26|nr:hypothetical protein [Shewanella sp. NIFS-20-20]MBV7317237.1 hypothetical protein [Shewanella sp. NIFS-20-20]
MSSPKSSMITAIGFVVLSWSLLLWLHLNMTPSIFAHFIAIPSLILLTGVAAWKLVHRHCC